MADQSFAKILQALSEAGINVIPATWEKTYFVVHSSGHFDFFDEAEDAHSRGYELGRGYYTFNEASLKTYGDRLRIAKEEWEKQVKDSHVRHVLRSLQINRVTI